MKLRNIIRRAQSLGPSRTSLLIASGLFLVGCGGDGDSGNPNYSQNVTKPEGVAAAPDPNAGLSRSELRRKEIEESRKEPVSKGKAQRARR